MKDQSVSLVASIIITTAVLFFMNGSGNLHASASPMWPASCQHVTTNFTIPSSGGHHEAIGCTFQSFINISAPQTLMNVVTSATVLVRNGIVSACTTCGIGVIGCPSTSNALAMGPLHITVSNMVFDQDAVLRFTGALPPSSSLVIANNSFHLTHTNINSGAYMDNKLHIAAIVIGNYTQPSLLLSYGSLLAVLDNSAIAVYKGSNAVTVSGIYFPLIEVTLLDTSSLAISRNRFVDIYSTTKIILVYWYTSSSLSSVRISVSNSSTIAMNNNSIINANVTGAAALIEWFSSNLFIITVAGRSTIAVNGNRVQNSTIGNAAQLVYWHTRLSVFSVVIANCSFLIISANGIEYSTVKSALYVVCWYNPGPINLLMSNNVTISMSDNRIENTSVGNIAYVVSWNSGQGGLSIAITNHSFLNMNGNNLCNANVTLATYVIYWLSSQTGALLLTATNSSLITLSCNSVINTTANNLAYVIHWNSISSSYLSIIVSDSSTLCINENLMVNTSVFVATSTSASLPTAAIVMWNFPRPSALTVSNRSILSVSKNAIEGTYVGVRNATVICWTFANATAPQLLTLNVSCSATVSLCDNAVLGSTVIGSVFVMQTIRAAIDLVIDNRSHLILSMVITNTRASDLAAGIYWPLLRELIIVGKSSLAVMGSRMADVAASEVFLTNFISTSPTSRVEVSSSSLSIQDNIMSTINYRKTVALFNWLGEQLLLDESIITVNGNQVSGNGEGSAQTALDFLLHSVIYFRVSSKGNNTRVAVEGNLLNISISTSYCPPKLLGTSSVAVGSTGGILMVSDNVIVIRGAPDYACPCMFFNALMNVAHVAITGNLIYSYSALHIEMSFVRVPAGNIIKVSRNILHFTSYYLYMPSYFISVSTIELGHTTPSKIELEQNTIQCFGAVQPNYSLIRVLGGTNTVQTTTSFIYMCRNVIFGDISSSSYPSRFVHPLELAHIVVACSFTLTQSPKVLTPSFSAETPTPITPSGLDVSSTFNISSSASSSLAPTSTHSASRTVIRSPGSASSTLSSLLSLSPAQTASLFENRLTASILHSATLTHPVPPVEVKIIIPEPIPAPLMEGITVAASAVGGVVAAVDADGGGDRPGGVRKGWQGQGRRGQAGAFGGWL